MPRLDANNGVSVGIKTGIPFKHIGGDGKGFDALCSTGQRFLDDVGPETAEPVGRVEIWACKDASESGPECCLCRPIALRSRGIPYRLLHQWVPLPFQGEPASHVRF